MTYLKVYKNFRGETAATRAAAPARTAPTTRTRPHPRPSQTTQAAKTQTAPTRANHTPTHPDDCNFLPIASVGASRIRFVCPGGPCGPSSETRPTTHPPLPFWQRPTTHLGRAGLRRCAAGPKQIYLLYVNARRERLAAETDRRSARALLSVVARASSAALATL